MQKRTIATVAAATVLISLLAVVILQANLLSIYDTTFEVTATSGYWQDIQNAVNQAASAGRGTVYIPAGTFNFVNTGESWTNARVTIPAGVNVIGSYTVNGDSVTWNTVLRIPWAVGGDPYGTWTGTPKPIPTMFQLEGNGDQNKPSKFAGIKLVGYRSINSNDHLLIRGIGISSVINYRVAYCYFEHITAGGVIADGKFCCGVTDHCWFINQYASVESMIENCDVSYGCSYFRSGYEDLWAPITEVLGKYTLYTHFVEDCHFARWRHEIAANDGAHYVARYNIIGPTFGFQIFDAHGTYNVVGTRAMEIYHNSYTQDIPGGPKSVAAWRGGGGVFFDNTIDSSFTYKYVMLLAEGTVEKCWAHDVYIWNSNAFAISYQAAQKVGSDGLLHPAPNIDFFTYKPDWYTPYTYPHPLTIGAPLPTPTPTVSPTKPPTSPTPLPSESPTPTLAPPPPPELTGNWFIDALNGLWHWLRWQIWWQIFGW